MVKVIKKSKKALIFGASGLIGKALVLELFDQGWDVVGVSRDPEKSKKQMPIDWVSPQLNEIEVLREVTHVVWLSGESVSQKRWTKKTRDSIFNSRGPALEDALKHLKSVCPHLKSIVSASAIGIYGDCGDQILSEESALGNSFLASVCRRWERAVFESEGFSQRISLRLPMVLSEMGGAMSELLPIFELGAGGNIGCGKRFMSWVSLDDAVSAFVFCLENDSVSGVFNVSANTLTNNEFTSTLASSLHRSAILPVPPVFLKLLLGDQSQIVLESQRVVSKKLEAQGFHFKYRSFEKWIAERLLCDGKAVLSSGCFITKIKKDSDSVFKFFTSPSNLRQITPSRFRFEVVSKERRIQKGDKIDFRMKIFGFPVKWIAEIVEFCDGKFFVDIQKKGVFSRFRHRHRFIERENETVVVDEIAYRFFFGMLAHLLVGKWAKIELNKLFTFRKTKLMEIFK